MTMQKNCVSPNDSKCCAQPIRSVCTPPLLPLSVHSQAPVVLGGGGLAMLAFRACFTFVDTEKCSSIQPLHVETDEPMGPDRDNTAAFSNGSPVDGMPYLSFCLF